MTQKEANQLMVERFEAAIEKAHNAQNDDDAIKHTDCAHKLYITLTQADAFEDKDNPMTLGN